MRRALFLIFGMIMMAYAAYAVYAIKHPRLTNDVSVQWSNIPPAAQERIMIHAEGGQINGIVRGIRDSKAYYTAAVKTPAGQAIILKVEETGKLVGLRYENDSEAGCGDSSAPPYSYPTR